MIRNANAVKRLREAGIDSPEAELRRLFRAIFDGVPEREIEDRPELWDAFDDAIDRRAARQPVSQILGRRAFWRHEFRVTPDVLDPRPETERLIESALAGPFSRLLDLGTGTGCIAISLLADRPDARGVATDLSAAALDVALDNARRIGIADRLDLVRSDWFGAVTGRFDLIVSNPPYIAADEMSGLAPEVRDWEPRAALTDGADGLSAYRAIAAGAGRHLAPAGRLLVEIGPTQGSAVAAIFRAAGLDLRAIHTDLDGRDRVVEAVPGPGNTP